jgi:hypothetical protein
MIFDTLDKICDLGSRRGVLGIGGEFSFTVPTACWLCRHD